MCSSHWNLALIRHLKVDKSAIDPQAPKKVLQVEADQQALGETLRGVDEYKSNSGS